MMAAANRCAGMLKSTWRDSGAACATVQKMLNASAENIAALLIAIMVTPNARIELLYDPKDVSAVANGNRTAVVFNYQRRSSSIEFACSTMVTGNTSLNACKASSIRVLNTVPVNGSTAIDESPITIFRVE